MSSNSDLAHLLAAVEDVRRAVARNQAGEITSDEALLYLAAVINDAPVVSGLSRLRRRPIERLKG